MFYVAAENLVPILIALLIGFITGLWIWKLARRPAAKPLLSEDDPLRRPYVDMRRDEPVADAFPTDDVDGGLASMPLAASPAAAEALAGMDAPGDEASSGDADDFRAMKGVGPKLAGLLRAQGIDRYDQIAALGPDDIARLDAHLGAFKGRLTRDRIVEQAAFLARGDREGYEREFGRL